MEVTERFERLVSEGEPALDEGAFLIAAHAHPGLDVDGALAQLDAIARGCPAATLDGLRQYLFEELGFRGNHDDYSDPENSFLDSVIDRRIGLPITLSVLTIEVARRVGVHLHGVGMPGHFLVRSGDDPGLFLDPFHGGRAMGEPECREIFESVNPATPWRGEFLDATPPSAVLWRMLANLHQAFLSRSSLGSLRWVLELQLRFPNVPARERRRVAALLGSVGSLDRAADELEAVAEELPVEAAQQARRQADVLRARLN